MPAPEKASIELKLYGILWSFWILCIVLGYSTYSSFFAFSLNITGFGFSVLILGTLPLKVC